MWFIRVFYLNGDIEVYRFSFIKGVTQGNLYVIDSSMNNFQIPWAEIYKTEVFKSEVV